MKRIAFVLGVTLAAGIAVGVIGSQVLSAQQELARGTVLQKTELAGIKGKEAALVLRELPPGKESGKHTQSGTEVAYILDGSVIFEMQGKPPVTLKAGDSFQTAPRARCTT